MRTCALILIIAAGLGLRLGQAWQGTDHNLDDSAAYERIARGLHEDGVFEQRGAGTPAHPQPASNYSPGLPLFVAGVFEVTGDDDTRLARILLAIIASLAIPLTWVLGRRLGGSDAGLAGAAIVAFYPTMVNDNSMLLTEPLAATLAIGSIVSVLKARDDGRLRSWILPGLLLGALTMVRPEYMLMSLLVAGTLVLLEVRGGLWHALRPPLVMVGVGFLVILPWGIHNLIHLDRMLPLSTGGGQTLFVGSYLPAHGDPQKVMPKILRRNPGLREKIEKQNLVSGEGADSITPERVFTIMANRRYPGVATDEALGRLGRDEYRRQWNEDPAAVIGLLAVKAQRIWWRGRGALTDPLPGRLLHWAIIVAALVGAVIAFFRRRTEFWILLPMFLGATLIGTVLVASPRRALVLWPLVSALAGLGLTGAIEFTLGRLKGRRRPAAIT